MKRIVVGVVASLAWGVIVGIISGNLGLSFGETLALTVSGTVIITGVAML